MKKYWNKLSRYLIVKLLKFSQVNFVVIDENLNLISRSDSEKIQKFWTALTDSMKQIITNLDNVDNVTYDKNPEVNAPEKNMNSSQSPRRAGKSKISPRKVW